MCTRAVGGCTKTGAYLHKLAWTSIKRHIMCSFCPKGCEEAGINSPFDPLHNGKAYWRYMHSRGSNMTRRALRALLIQKSLQGRIIFARFALTTFTIMNSLLHLVYRKRKVERIQAALPNDTTLLMMCMPQKSTFIKMESRNTKTSTQSLKSYNRACIMLILICAPSFFLD
jgi:hypothetical protein